MLRPSPNHGTQRLPNDDDDDDDSSQVAPTVRIIICYVESVAHSLPICISDVCNMLSIDVHSLSTIHCFLERIRGKCIQ